MRPLLACAALLLISGCDSAITSQLELVIDRTQFMAGDEALVVLDNDTGRDELYASCTFLLRFDETRRFVPIQESTPCAADRRGIGAGQSIAIRVPLPDNLETGTYVVSLPIGGEGTGSVQSGRFEIVASE